MERLYLSVIIPCYNEEARIGPTLEKAIAFLAQQPYLSEIRVIDDGSTDQTFAVCQSFQTKFPRLTIQKVSPNHGKGYAVKTGMMEAQGDYCLFTDADGSTPIEEVTKLLKVIEEKKADIVIGSRSIRGARVQQAQPWYRMMMGKTFNKFVRMMVLPGFIDTQCGFKLFSREAAHSTFSRQTLWGFSFDVEILYIARLMGYNIVEYPINWFNSPQSKVNPVKDSLRMLKELRQIRKNHATLRREYNSDGSANQGRRS